MKTSKILLLVLSAGLLASCNSGTNVNSDGETQYFSSSAFEGETATREEALSALGVAYYNLMTSDKTGVTLTSNSIAVTSDMFQYTYAATGGYTVEKKQITVDVDRLSLGLNAEGLTGTDVSGFKASATINSADFKFTYADITSGDSATTIENLPLYYTGGNLYMDLTSESNVNAINSLVTTAGASASVTSSLTAGKYYTPVGYNYAFLLPDTDFDGTAYDSTGAKIKTLIENYITGYGLSSIIDEHVTIKKSGTAINLDITVADKDALIESAREGMNVGSSSMDSSYVEAYIASLEAMVTEFKNFNFNVTIDNGRLTNLYLNVDMGFLTNYGSSHYQYGGSDSGYVSAADDEYALTETINADINIAFNYGTSVTLPSDIADYELVESTSSIISSQYSSVNA